MDSVLDFVCEISIMFYYICHIFVVKHIYTHFWDDTMIPTQARNA